MTLIGQLNTLESTGLVRLIAAQPELEYLFRHALVQDAAYGSLLKQDRKQLHLAVGEALEHIYPDQLDERAATLAYHFERAEKYEKAARYFQQAGDGARAGFANAEAIAFYQAAISQVDALLSDPHAVPDAWRAALVRLYEGVGDLQELTGLRELAVASYERALARVTTTDRVARARLYRKTANAWVIQREQDRAFRAFAEAESSLGDEPTEAASAWWQEWIQIQLDQTWLRYVRTETSEIAALVERTRPALEQYGTPAQRFNFLRGIVLETFLRERCTVSDALLGLQYNALTAAQASGSLNILGLAYFMVGFSHLWRDELKEAEEYMQAGRQLAERIGDVTTLSRCLTYLIVLYRKRGLMAETKDYIVHTLKVAERGQMLEYTAMCEANLSWLAWREGDLSEAREHGDAALALWQRTSRGLFGFQWPALCPLLAVALAEDQLSAAVEYARRLVAPELQRLPEELETTLQAALQAAEQGQAEIARSQFEQAVRLAQNVGYL